MASSATAFLTTTLFSLPSPPKPSSLPSFTPRRSPSRFGTTRLTASAYNVTIEHQGKATVVEVEEDEIILEKVLDAGVHVPHECQLGVCMKCPAKLVTGEVDQSDGGLGEDAVEKGYVHLCASYPRSDCTIRTISPEELASLQLSSLPE